MSSSGGATGPSQRAPWSLCVLLALLLTLACQPATAPAEASPTVADPSATPVAHTPTPLSTIPPPPTVIIEGVSFTVEVAATAEEKAQGLMGREGLKEGHGMLFLFQSDGMPGFWMRNMRFPLDIVWIDGEGVVAGVTPRVPPAGEGVSAPLYHPPRPVRYVLEITAGAAEDTGIQTGSRVAFVGILWDQAS